MKVLLTKPFFEEDINYIKERINPNVELVTPKDYTEDCILEELNTVDVLFGGMITEKILEEGKHLKFIQIPWTGVDNLNFELLQKYQTPICNSHSNANIVAEHAVALMFDAAKKMSYHDRLMREGNWNRPGLNSNALSPFSKNIFNSKIGIVGFGAIGKSIYNMLAGFNCNFKVFNRSKKSLIDTVNINSFSISELQDQVGDLDFIFITLPLTDDTRGIIDNKFFSKLNEKSVLINVSRGAIIDEQALYNHLVLKKEAFAAIDTWYNYPNKSNPITFPSQKFKFQELNNLILSPHRAGFIDSGFPHLDDAIININLAFKKEELINVISTTNNY